jgi:hypothetical protein
MVWKVSAHQGQYVRLADSSGTAVIGTDTGSDLQWWNGNQWQNYTPSTFVKVPGAGALLVRMAVTNDFLFEGPETLNLTVYNTQGVANPAETGIATIRDDGSGDIFSAANNTGLADPMGSSGTPAFLDDDRVAPAALVQPVTPIAEVTPVPAPTPDTAPNLHVLGAVSQSRGESAAIDTQTSSRTVMAMLGGAAVDGRNELARTDALIAKFERVTDPALHVQMAVDASRQQSFETQFKVYGQQSGLLRESSLLRDSAPVSWLSAGSPLTTTLADQTLAEMHKSALNAANEVSQDMADVKAWPGAEEGWRHLKDDPDKTITTAPKYRGQLSFSQQLKSFASQKNRASPRII